MKLLDAANVETKAPGGWERGWDGDSRVCGNVSIYLAECDPAVTADVLGDRDDEGVVDDCGYVVRPFGIVAQFYRNTRSAQDDDQDWLAKQFLAAAEIPVSRGLLIRQGSGDTWIGNPDVEQVAAPALTDTTATGAAIAEARRRFFRKTIGIDPILHVNPDNALALKRAGVLELDPVTGNDRTAWGDQVVISSGYYDVPGLTANPVAFYTGPVEISLSTPRAEDVVVAVQQNKIMYQATMIAAIDTPPCAMVRVGAAPAPVGP